ncbi:MAG: hypothetical protein AAGJ18_23145 [Bacteroidota bacterium]
MSKKHIIQLASLLLLLSIFSTANAQIGAKLKNRLKGKKEEAKMNATDRAKAKANNTTSAATAKKVDLDYTSAPFMPAITMYSLLNDGIQLTVDGKLFTKGLSVNLLPTKTAKGEKANYDEYKKEDLLLTSELVNTKTDKVVGMYHYSVNPVMKVGSVMNQKKVNDNEDFFYKIGAGNYALKFYAGGEHFYTFPFEVVAIQNEDAYATFSEVLFLKGAWESWNYFDTQDYNGRKVMVWHHFMDNTTTDIENEFRTESNCEYKYRYELLQSGKVIGAHDSRMTASKNAGYNLKIDYAEQSARRTHWIDHGVQLSRIPGDPKNWDKLELEDLKDGNYEMVLHTLDCANNKKKRVFPFKVAGRKVVQHGQQNRKIHQDHTTIVEGGRDKFWFRIR